MVWAEKKRLWMPSQGQWGTGGLFQLRPDQMKALERDLEREYFEGEARTPKRSQELGCDFLQGEGQEMKE